MKGEGNSTVLVALSPNGNVLSTLLSYVWSLWEDPLDVSSQAPFFCHEIISLWY